jgi:alpha-glucosidase (family GH31 glycosyl hydrolase)
MDKFAEENVPITVATVDMDWHWVKGIEEKFGVKYGGWTGYSWNTELFPDYRQFLKELKEKNLHITLNLHPADGVFPFEDMYEDMAKAVGVNPETKEKIDFRCSDDEFWNAYFDVLHKPYESEGVDFWWIDWQQGKKSDVEGLDPLNALNHYHFLDNAEDGRMPLILSRYAGLGSHRYPLGFSGDTAINHKVFDFQPYFTVNAANAAYSWWSHDIGGHHFGYRDDELYLRWLQFGVLSPIMRLHSTAIELLGKEPWKYRADICENAEKWLRFRHSLIPYIFTMDYRTHTSGEALCEPMYYSYPENRNAYEYKNEYMFGTELLVCPITSKQHKSINMGSVEAWLPKGRWVDIFTCQAYEGERNITLFRDLNTIPVLAKEGAIIPLSADRGNRTDNPENLEIWAFSGNGEFTLYEDNSKVDYELHNAKTRFEMKFENCSVSFTVNAADGDLTVLPEKRNYRVVFKDLVNADRSEAVLEFRNLPVGSAMTLTLENVRRKEKNEPRDEVIWAFSRWQGGTMRKNAKYLPFKKLTKPDEIREKLKKAPIPKELKLLIEERI